MFVDHQLQAFSNRVADKLDAIVCARVVGAGAGLVDALALKKGVRKKRAELQPDVGKERNRASPRGM